MRRARERFIEQMHRECPHHVDLIPPPNGYGVKVEEAIFAFIDERIGAMDMYGEVKEGVAFVRYCFLKESDADLFREKFATAGEIINFPKAVNG
jgi:hypothetical protein